MKILYKCREILVNIVCAMREHEQIVHGIIVWIYSR